MPSTLIHHANCLEIIYVPFNCFLSIARSTITAFINVLNYSLDFGLIYKQTFVDWNSTYSQNELNG